VKKFSRVYLKSLCHGDIFFIDDVEYIYCCTHPKDQWTIIACLQSTGELIWFRDQEVWIHRVKTYEECDVEIGDKFRFVHGRKYIATVINLHHDSAVLRWERFDKECTLVYDLSILVDREFFRYVPED